MSQFGILEALHHKGPMCQHELASSILKSGGNITMVVDNLIKRSLVRRERSTEDRRYITIHLTKEGSRLIASIFPEHAADIVQAMASLSAAEQKQLSVLCKKLGLGRAGKDQIACIESAASTQTGPAS